MSAEPKAPALFWLADHAPQIFFEAMELSYNLSGMRKLGTAIRVKRPDLIYERYAFFNMAGAWTSKRFGIPLIVEVNELSGYDRVREQVMVPLAQKIERAVFRQAALIIVVSKFLKDKIAALIQDDKKILVVPNGVSNSWLDAHFSQDDLITRRREIGLENKRIIGFVGGLTHWHNFDFLLDVLQQLKTQYPDLVLLIIGDGPLRESIMGGAEKRNLKDAVIITGRIAHQAVRQYIELFDAAVIPHSNQYRSPIKLFEYMGAGKPVVAASTEPIEAVIKNGEAGFTFLPSDLDDAVSKLTMVFSDNRLAEETGERAKKTIKQHYLWEQHATGILSSLRIMSL